MEMVRKGKISKFKLIMSCLYIHNIIECMLISRRFGRIFRELKALYGYYWIL